MKATEPLLDLAENNDDFETGKATLLNRNSTTIEPLWLTNYISNFENTLPPRNQAFIVGGIGHRNLLSSLR